MPDATARSATKIDLARRNGALSRGPITAAGKARSARNAIRHGLCARIMVLVDGDDTALAALRAAIVARHRPRGEAERRCVDELVSLAWRQRRLLDLEAAAQTGLVTSASGPRRPSAATLRRYRARLALAARRAEEELAHLRRVRPHAAGTNEPTATPCTNEILPGTNEPTPVAAGAMRPLPGGVRPKYTNEFAAGTNEPTAPARQLNRHQRRRLAALARRCPPAAARPGSR